MLQHMQKALPHIEIVLPIYNEIENLPILLAECDRAIALLKGQATVSYLFINDGSSDGSKEALDALYLNRRDVRVMHLLHNFGHTAAIAAGIEYFQGDIALVMDADLQDPPSSMVPMFEAWKKGAETVVAERGDRKEVTAVLFNTFYYLLHKVARGLPPVNFGTHSMLDKSVVNRIKKLKERNRYFPGLVALSSTKVTPITIDRGARAHGRSRVGTFGLINLASNAFLSFSTVPVRLVSWFGLLVSLGALIFGTSIVCIKLFTDKAIPGWASTMSLIAFSTGTQLLCLGIIGEYIARIYDEVKERPLFLVDEVRDHSQETVLPRKLQPSFSEALQPAK